MGTGLGVAKGSLANVDLVIRAIRRHDDPGLEVVLLVPCWGPLAWWRTQIGFVGQEPVLFKGTIAENIR